VIGIEGRGPTEQETLGSIPSTNNAKKKKRKERKVIYNNGGED
jgi:hypothetical protein